MGVGETVWLVAVITVIEVGALAVVAVLAGDSLGDLPERRGELVPAGTTAAWSGVFAGAFLVFYAFIGFEDMVNMAEEVKRPRWNMPVGILVSVVLTVAIYVPIGLIGVLSVEPALLAESDTPMATIVGGDSWFADPGLVLVSMLAGVNGALVQIVMAARVSYGMARRGQAPPMFGWVFGPTKTPVFATVVMTGVVLALALYFPLTSLAKATSTIILVVFALVNLALWQLKRREGRGDAEGPRFPDWLPLVGFVACVGVLSYRVWELTIGG